MNSEQKKAIEAFRKHSDLLEGDGWTVYAEGFYQDRGLPKPLMISDYMVVSGEGKHAITRTDGSVGDVKGVHHLTWLWKAAWFVEADTSLAERLHGRGSQAEALNAAIREVVERYGKKEEAEREEERAG
jgi:hypothetical protein